MPQYPLIECSDPDLVNKIIDSTEFVKENQVLEEGFAGIGFSNTLDVYDNIVNEDIEIKNTPALKRIIGRGLHESLKENRLIDHMEDVTSDNVEYINPYKGILEVKIVELTKQINFLTSKRQYFIDRYNATSVKQKIYYDSNGIDGNINYLRNVKSSVIKFTEKEYEEPELDETPMGFISNMFELFTSSMTTDSTNEPDNTTETVNINIDISTGEIETSIETNEITSGDINDLSDFL